MKFSTSFLYLENVAYDPLIRNFPISAAFQGEKIFFSRSKVAPKWPFRFPGTGNEITPCDVTRCENPSACHSFSGFDYEHTVWTTDSLWQLFFKRACNVCACEKRESPGFSVTTRADYKRLERKKIPVCNTNVAGILCFHIYRSHCQWKLFSCHGFKLSECTQLQPLMSS